MAEKKVLKLSDVKSAKTEKPRFNTLDALAQIVDPAKMVMFTHKAKRVVVVAAKDTGKDFPIYAYSLYCMERDPMASGLGMMKYSTGAAKRGARAFYSVLNVAKRDFAFPLDYEPGQSYMFRKKDKKNNLNNQSIEFSSFENTDSLAGFSISNGGYPAFIFINEPMLQGDTNTPSFEEWNAAYKTVLDTVSRHWRTYAQTNPFHAPIPFKTFIAANDWEPEHPISKETEHYHPQIKFLDWVLGYEYSLIRKMWKDKINGQDVVAELKEWVDARWEQIQENVINNHTKWIYVEKDNNGRTIDTLFGRMQKMANPTVRNDESARESVYEEMYSALITGSTLELAKAFGMGYDGTVADEKRFNFRNFLPTDTDKKLREPGRKLLGFSLGWDHDANRGAVATPVTYSAKIKNVGSQLNPVAEWYDHKIMIHPQVLIEGYGKGQMGKNTELMHEQMRQISVELMHKYCGLKPLEYGKHATFDDDDGSYVYKIAPHLIDAGFDVADALENKNGKIPTGGFGVPDRDDIWQTGVDFGDIIIDEKNDLLVEWLKQVPFTTGANGEKKRSTEGKWMKRYKDVSNSAEYGWWTWRYTLLSLGMQVNKNED